MVDKEETQITPVMPLVSPEIAAEQWKKFELLKEKLLSDDDYQIIAGKRFIKRSGFRKLGLYFGISDRILKEERVDRPDGSFMWRIVAEVIAPNGRTCIGVGACDSRERKFAHAEHDVFATSHTRAKSRAISDMVAGGIVSAEEVEASLQEIPVASTISAPPTPTTPPEAKWVMKVPVTRESISQPGVKQYVLGQGLNAFGMFNVLEDGSEASIVPENPVDPKDPAIKNFLVSKILRELSEKTGAVYQLDVEGEFLYAVLIRGKLEEAEIKNLVNASRWAFQKATTRGEEEART